MHRVTSLSDNERLALTSLLIDVRSDSCTPPSSSPQQHDNSRQLTKDILLSTPFPGIGNIKKDLSDPLGVEDRNSQHRAGLWTAHELGFLPEIIRKGSSLFQEGVIATPATVPLSPTQFSPQVDFEQDMDSAAARMKSTGYAKQQSNVSVKTSDAEAALVSQCEVRPERASGGSVSSASSWDDAPTDHYDTWQVMNDEYAEEFGFDYKPVGGNVNMDDAEQQQQIFQILGASANDKTAHVLSPPLMESLMNFVPESLSEENWWLKYSLITDGANLETFRNEAKSSQYTLIAIQTTNGDVFGSFNTSPWQVEHGYFGSGESFVWKMRYNRFRHCSSLYEQAHMESEVDIYPSSGLNSSFQLFNEHFLGIGSGEIENDKAEFSEQIFTHEQKLGLGFAIALHEDLQQGTSSPSATYCNPLLTSGRDGFFEVHNLEVWTFTPCTEVKMAKKLEMKKQILHESMVHSSMSSKAQNDWNRVLSE